MYYYRILFLIFLCVLQIDLKAQYDQDLITVADEMYKFGDIKDARDVYSQAVEANPSNAYAQYMTGKCYLETIQKEKSLPFLLKAYEIDNDIVFNILFLIGTSYQLSYNFDKAMEYYELYRKKLMKERENTKFPTKEEVKKIDKRIIECKNGMEFIEHPVNVKIENMGKEVNSTYKDYAPVVSSDGSILFFTSRRQGSTGGNKANDNEFYEDVYVSYKENGNWTDAQNVGPTINTNLHEACIGISPDGKELFIYVDDNKHPGDIFMCHMDGKGGWSKPKPLSKEINSQYIENSVTITVDGKTLYFASNRPGGMGGVDIYKSRMSKTGEWGKPENLGDVINTEYDEEAPFIDADGRTLYFSSRGHKGMGGFDLFKTVLDSVTGKWSEPENLGYPINSTDDDIDFVVTGDGKYGYYASVKEDGLGDEDLFRVSLHEQAVKETTKDTKVAPKEEKVITKNNVAPKNTLKPEIEKPKALPVTLHLNITSSDRQTPLDAAIEILDPKSNTSICKGIAKGGEFSYSFNNKGGRQYKVVVSKEGYVYKKEKIIIPDTEEKKIDYSIALDKIDVGYRFILRNIYYDYNKASLKPSSFPELEKLYGFLKQNPKVKIEIEGHTDSKGSDRYNLRLSELRAQSVAAYLIKRGIPAERIVYKGLGETKPLASNDDEDEGRELNRRTEFVILAK